MINKVTEMTDALSHIKSGDTIMVGGFTLSGCPLSLLHGLSRMKVNNLTTISEDLGFVNAAFYENAAGALLKKNMIKKICVSFLGGNKTVHKLINDGKIEYELIPQGTLAERIRAAGSGLGGVITPTGVGTVVEEGKQTLIIEGKKYILEMPLRAEIALVKAYKADSMGNAVFKYSAMNFNNLMAMAADIVILECEELVEPGEINPEQVQLPGVFVDYVVKPKKEEEVL